MKIKEVTINLIDSPDSYNIVSEIDKNYNFHTGLNNELKQKFATNQLLPQSKTIREIQYFNSYNRYIIFMITKNKSIQLSTYENIYVALLYLKQIRIDNSLPM